jgi:hypothetical protein
MYPKELEDPEKPPRLGLGRMESFQIGDHDHDHVCVMYCGSTSRNA